VMAQKQNILKFSLKYGILCNSTAFICVMKEADDISSQLPKEKIVIPTITSIDYESDELSESSDIFDYGIATKKLAANMLANVYGSPESHRGGSGGRGGQVEMKSRKRKQVRSRSDSRNRKGKWSRSRSRDKARRDRSRSRSRSLEKKGKSKTKSKEVSISAIEKSRSLEKKSKSKSKTKSKKVSISTIERSRSLEKKSKSKTKSKEVSISAIEKSRSLEKKSKSKTKGDKILEAWESESKGKMKIEPQSDKLMDIVKAQKLSGFWECNEEVVKMIGKSYKSIQEKLPVEIKSKAPSDIVLAVWITIIMLYVLETQYSSKKVSWSMIQRKANKWLSEKGFDYSKFKGQAAFI